jgi:hypothetical protein
MPEVRGKRNFGRRHFGVNNLGSFSLRSLAILLSNLLQREFVAKLFVVAAWFVFLFIVFATLAPLQLRPVVSHDAQLERFGAFATAGLLFGLAYPHRLIANWSFLIGAAGLLQRLTNDRHGHLHDAGAKALGGTFGLAVALMILAVLARYRPRLPSASHP